MTRKNDNTILWIIGIILLIIILPKIPFAPRFAIVTTQVCAEGVEHYYSFDGNLLDSKGNLDAVNHGAIFVSGKINQGIEFNGTNYISFPAIPPNLSVSMWINNYSNSDGLTYFLNTGIPLSETFGLGLNGSVDEIIIGTNISGLSGIQPCYTQTTYENVTCQEYASSQMPDQSSGCLNYSGEFFPNCTYSWENLTTYKIESNLCKKNYYCISACLVSNACYSTNQLCTENLVYDCYLLINNNCVLRTDYASCILNTSYSNLSNCNANIVLSSTTATTTTTPSTEENISDILTKERFEIFGFSVNMLHLIVILVGVIAVLYLSGVLKKK